MNNFRKRVCGGKGETQYTLVVTDNQNGASNAVTDATVTVKYTLNGITTMLGSSYKNGATFLIPDEATITVTGNNSFGNYTNANFTPDTTVNGTTYTVTYKAQKVTITSNSSTTITLRNTTKGTNSVSSSGTSITGYVAWGNKWRISAPATTSKYPVISPTTGIADSVSTTSSITMTSYTLITSNAADLGLPSGKLWAAKNVGASNYYNEGLYFSWGDTTGHAKNSGYDFSTSNYSSGASGSGYNLTNSFTSGDVTYDAARANMGSTWRTPTEDEVKELIENCIWIFTTFSNKKGYVVVNNSKGIFIPYVGTYSGTSNIETNITARYWESTQVMQDKSTAQSFGLGNYNYIYQSYFSRYKGLGIRAIKDPD